MIGSPADCSKWGMKQIRMGEESGGCDCVKVERVKTLIFNRLNKLASENFVNT